MVVLSEASTYITPSASADDLNAATEAARIVGCHIYTIPQDFTDCKNAENALWHVPVQPNEALGVCIGYISSAERYQQIYNTALTKGIRLINTPGQYRATSAAFKR